MNSKDYRDEKLCKLNIGDGRFARSDGFYQQKDWGLQNDLFETQVEESFENCWDKISATEWKISCCWRRS